MHEHSKGHMAPNMHLKFQIRRRMGDACNERRYECKLVVSLFYSHFYGMLGAIVANFMALYYSHSRQQVRQAGTQSPGTTRGRCWLEQPASRIMNILLERSDLQFRFISQQENTSVVLNYDGVIGRCRGTQKHGACLSMINVIFF